MRRTGIVVVMIVGLAARARADGNKDVQAAVTKAVLEVGDPDNKAYANIWDDKGWATFPVIMGQINNSYFGIYSGKVKEKLGTTTIALVDPHTAWFHGVVDASYWWAPETDMGQKGTAHTITEQLHISGIATDNHGWKITAFMWSPVQDDAKLLSNAVAGGGTSDVTYQGDSAISKQVASWIATRLAAHKAAGLVAANGTSAPELASGAVAVDKLVAGWDKLKLSPTSVEARTFAGGKVAFAVAEVALPTKTGTSAMMKLALTLVPDGSGWRWTTLNFSPARFDN